MSAQKASPSTAAGVKLEHIDGISWNELASDFEDAVHEQTHCFNTSRWGFADIENICFRQGDRVIGGASVIVMKFRPFGTGLATVKWGPLWRKRGQSAEPSRLKAMLALLQQEYAVQQGLFLTVIPYADPVYTTATTHALETLGFGQGDSLLAPERYLVNTSLESEELRQSLHHKWRYNLKKAEKNDFEIEFASGNDALDSFMKLYAQMMARKQFMDSSAISTLKDLMECSSETFRPSIVLLSHQGTVTAGGVFDLSGDTAVYLYGATDDRALALKAGYVLHWWMASHLCGLAEAHWYDLGGNDRDNGLHQFKKGFVGKAGKICITPPVYHYGATARASLAGHMVFKAKELKAAMLRISYRLKQFFKK